MVIPTIYKKTRQFRRRKIEKNLQEIRNALDAVQHMTLERKSLIFVYAMLVLKGINNITGTALHAKPNVM